jgi:hypothetical protein
MRIKPVIFGIFVLTIFLCTIWAFRAYGFWSVSGKLTRDGQAVQPLPNDVNSIKGWMTLDQVISTYGITLDELITQFNLPADTSPSIALKDLERYSFSVQDLRTWLLTRINFTLTQTPDSKPSVTPTAPIDSQDSLLSDDHIAPEKLVTGRTTFQQLLDWGVSEDAIAQIIGNELPELSMLVKDFVTQQNMSFSTIKIALQAEVDGTK